MTDSLFEKLGLSGIVFLIVLVLLYINNVNATLTITLSIIAGVITWIIEEYKKRK